MSRHPDPPSGPLPGSEEEAPMPPLGEFFQEEETYLGLGLWLDVC